MVYVVAKNFIKEGKVREFIALAKKLERETNAKDKGCIKYVLVRDKDNPNTFAFIEEWESQDALDAHTKSAHFTEIVPKLSEFLSKPGEPSFFVDAE